MPKKEKTKESSGGGKFQWILFIVIIPLVVLVIVTGTILYMAGYDLKKPLQNIPGISSLIGSDDTSKTSSSNNDQRDTELKALKKTIKEQENELEIAQKDLKTSDEEIKRLNQKINSLEKHLIKRTRQQVTVHQAVHHQVITHQDLQLIRQHLLISNQKERSPAFMKAWMQGNLPKFYQS